MRAWRRLLENQVGQNDEDANLRDLPEVVLSALHRDFVGERPYPVVSEMMIDLLCRQFFEPNG